MDDRNFDKETASEWISVIEAQSARIREQDIYHLLKKWQADHLPRNILEIGCGQGVCSAELDLRNCTYVGTDPSPSLVQRAQELYQVNHCEFVLGNAYSLPFSDLYFEAAFSIAVWHLLENIERASSELARVLKKDGRFLVITADPAHYSAWTERYIEKHFDGKRFVGKNKLVNGLVTSDVLYLHSQENIVHSLEKNGLKVKHFSTFRNQLAITGSKI